MSHPEVASLVAAMLQARDAVERRSWSHQQEPTGEAWWADVLADPRARTREGRTDLAVKQAFYRLADEKREIILVACSKCDWRAAFARDELIASHGADCAMPNLKSCCSLKTFARVNIATACGGPLIQTTRLAASASARSRSLVKPNAPNTRGLCRPLAPRTRAGAQAQFLFANLAFCVSP